TAISSIYPERIDGAPETVNRGGLDQEPPDHRAEAGEDDEQHTGRVERACHQNDEQAHQGEARKVEAHLTAVQPAALADEMRHLVDDVDRRIREEESHDDRRETP